MKPISRWVRKHIQHIEFFFACVVFINFGKTILLPFFLPLFFYALVVITFHLINIANKMPLLKGFLSETILHLWNYRGETIVFGK